MLFFPKLQCLFWQNNHYMHNKHDNYSFLHNWCGDQAHFFKHVITQWFSTGVPRNHRVLSEQFRGSASCLWKMNFVCVYQKHDPILKSCARNIRLKFLIEFFTVCINNFRDRFRVKTFFFLENTLILGQK